MSGSGLAKAILVHRQAVPGLATYVAGLDAFPRRALSETAAAPDASIGAPPAAPVAMVAAFVELWGEAEALRAAVACWPEAASAWLVEETRPADAPRSWPSGSPSPGLRRVSSVFRRPGLARAAFAEHWRTRHAAIAMSFTVPIWRYGQNVVVEALRGDGGEDGFAVLHFRTARELAARWAEHPDEAQRGREDAAQFMDLARGFDAIMTETLWEAADPGAPAPRGDRSADPCG
ncbi:MAG: hypothetical protein R3F21_02275 [Myxococcota bacterium]